VLGAFVASSEAIRAYQPAVAIAAFVLIGIFSVSGLYLGLRANWLHSKTWFQD